VSLQFLLQGTELDETEYRQLVKKFGRGARI
jgi:hypothetical protein